MDNTFIGNVFVSDPKVRYFAIKKLICCVRISPKFILLSKHTVYSHNKNNVTPNIAATYQTKLRMCRSFELKKVFRFGQCNFIQPLQTVNPQFCDTLVHLLRHTMPIRQVSISELRSFYTLIRFECLSPSQKYAEIFRKEVLTFRSWTSMPP